jgi:hypothetical protein
MDVERLRRAPRRRKRFSSWRVAFGRLRLRRDERLMNRGAPLVATPTRWLVGTVVFAAASTFLLESMVKAYATVSRSGPPVSLSWLIVVALGFSAPLLWVALRTGELRLARELRIARTGTFALRATVTQRKAHSASSLGRLISTKLGRAAVSLAEGERMDALDACEGGSPLMRGGRLEALRRVVEADIERASGAPAGLEECVLRLRKMPRIGNREADLYRVHVLAKALLEQGDASGAADLAQELEASGDDEERMYRSWLRAWFDLEGASGEGSRSWAPLPEGELRMATLLARAHGADKLVEKLEGRVAAIARPAEGE